MKTILLSIPLLVMLASCQKEASIAPVADKPTATATAPVLVLDTIPDGGAFKIKMQNDSTPMDETSLNFDHTASSAYSFYQDARYFPGFGIGSLSSISCDGVLCAIKKMPYAKGMAIGLHVSAKSNGVYLLKVSYLNKIPSDVRIWLKDAYKKDSLDLRVANYSFNVLKSDTSSFGSGRFKIILR